VAGGTAVLVLVTFAVEKVTNGMKHLRR
jgi:hypothetical protein